VPDFAEDNAAAAAESRWWRRLGRSFVSADSYGLVLLLVVVTYVVSVSVTETRAASIVLTVQLATVWLTLRTSPGAGRQPRADLRRAGGGHRAALPGSGRRKDHQQPAAQARLIVPARLDVMQPSAS
jgi:hypothetical protein